MIIFGWIFFVFVILSVATVFNMKVGDNFFRVMWEITIGFFSAVLAIALVIFFCIGFVWLCVNTLGDDNKNPTPSVTKQLICNNVVIAEAVNGFYMNRSGAYESHYSTTTYTPKQGEICLQQIK